MAMWIFQFVVSLAVMALTYRYYAGANGMMDGLPEMSPVMTYIVVGAVLAVPLFWAATHVIGGLLFGIVAGGFLDGVKLGCILGLGLSIGKLWPYAAAGAAGTLLGDGPALYVWGGFLLSGALFALDRFMDFFWHSTRNGSSH